MASISLRESIRWLPDKANEPTSTIVLTSPQKRFVDIRILNRADGDSTNDSEDVIPPARLDWAIAGTSSSTPAPDHGPDATHSKWKHWIDSRTLDAASVIDEGLMSPEGASRTLEVGSMVNPETGIMTDYEEVWIDAEPEPVPGDDSWQIVVLRYDGQEKRERGSLIRIGRICQGLLRTGDEIRAERWEWIKLKGWTRTKRVGDGTGLPCKAILGQWNGTSFKHENRKWEVLETDNV